MLAIKKIVQLKKTSFLIWSFILLLHELVEFKSRIYKMTNCFRQTHHKTIDFLYAESTGLSGPSYFKQPSM